jgi:hypothetical protein
MKQIIAITVAALMSLSLQAAWNNAVQTGLGGNPVFTGSGVPLTVLASIRSNTLYTITSANAPGAPLVQEVWIKPDDVTCTLDFWVPTNTWTIASNGALATNIIWLTSTNKGMASNSVCVYQSGDTYQMTIALGSGALGALVYTNDAGQNGIAIFNTLTNYPLAGDKLYMMAKVATFTPLTMQNATNDVAAPWGNWWQVATRAGPLRFSGVIGYPLLTTLSYSNAAGLMINGVYQRR